MRYYIAYKFLNADKEILKKNLWIISDMIERTGNTTFIFNRDVQNRWEISMPINQVITQAFAEVKKSDAILAFIESEEKSEWMLLEVGYAKALGKNLILVIKRGINFRFLRALANKTIEFDTIDEIELLNNLTS